MPPRKKPKSSALKPNKQSSANQSSQPSSVGIQQLFQRHIQNSQSTSNSLASNAVVSTPQNPLSTVDEKKPDESKDVVDQGLTEASPEVSRNAKRFKFSPGMVAFFSYTLFFCTLICYLITD